ncbi:MAG: hypothetical protein AUJ70_04265 [Candidatus Omnitrophica bacterium CG1_02_40_15]|nr:MAG: hypothetical protein AUJ70_04265 [Candidatus Omnitrophica bacterium CG1_02_40_15]
MFKYLIVILSIFIIIFTRPVFADTVGAVKDSKSSWYAVIGSENKGKKLYMKGDIFSPDKNPANPLRILDIKKDSLVLEDVVLKNSIIVRPGENIPIEGAGMIFEKTVESSVLEYNYNKPPKKFTKNQLEDFTIKSLEKKKIVLEKPYNASSQVKQLSNKEKEIFNSPRDQDADKNVIITELFNKINSKKIGDNVWALNRPSAEPAIHNAGLALISAIKRVEPRYRLGEGPSLKFNTDLGTAVVNKEGFLIQNLAVAKLTENFGIKEGDIIKSINGCPVNSLLGIYRAYENIASDKSAKLLSINIARDGKAKTLVYKIK